jgi:orotate phosphoribosyltransferase
MRDDELILAIRDAAFMTGDFVLRSGKRSPVYVDKYRVATQPRLLAEIGARLAAAVERVDPDAVRLAAPEVGAVPLAAAAALTSQLPFLIVRREAKAYGTGNRVEGAFSPGERVCLVEDIVTTGGAAEDAILALREAGLECANAICIVDREEGGADTLARIAVRLWPMFRLADFLDG